MAAVLPDDDGQLLGIIKKISFVLSRIKDAGPLFVVNRDSLI